MTRHSLYRRKRDTAVTAPIQIVGLDNPLNALALTDTNFGVPRCLARIIALFDRRAGQALIIKCIQTLRTKTIAHCIAGTTSRRGVKSTSIGGFFAKNKIRGPTESLRASRIWH